MAQQDSSFGILALTGLVFTVFLSPALCCGWILGIDTEKIVLGVFGWFCSLIFWVVLGVLFLVSNTRSSDDD